MRLAVLAVTHLRIHNVIHQSVQTILLIVTNDAHGLFAHGALICVAWALIVMGIGHQPSTNAQQCERLHFQMRGFIGNNFVLTSRNKRIVFFIYVQILDEAICQEVIEFANALIQFVHMGLAHQRNTFINNYVWTAQAASVRVDVYATLHMICMNGHETTD